MLRKKDGVNKIVIFLASSNQNAPVYFFAKVLSPASSLTVSIILNAKRSLNGCPFLSDVIELVLFEAFRGNLGVNFGGVRHIPKLGMGDA